LEPDESNVRYAKAEYEQEKSNEELELGELKPTKIAYAIVLRTTLETLPALKADLKKCFAGHGVILVASHASVGFLKVVEVPWSSEESKREERP